jgi:hypothetical protein
MPDILAILTHERDKLNRAIEALGDNVGHALIKLTKAGKPASRQGKHTVSAEARARMAAGQKARWARMKSAAQAPKAPAKAPAKAAATFTPPKKKFTMSPEARARISAGAKARWARIKSGK